MRRFDLEALKMTEPGQDELALLSALELVVEVIIRI
jgi:hypothetical protein